MAATDDVITKRLTPLSWPRAARARRRRAPETISSFRVFRTPGGQRRGNVRHVLQPAIASAQPASAFRSAAKEAQPAVVDGQQLAHAAFPGEAAHGRVHRPAFGDELPDQEAGDVAAAAGDEHRVDHRRLLGVTPAGAKWLDGIARFSRAISSMSASNPVRHEGKAGCHLNSRLAFAFDAPRCSFM